MSEKEMEKCKIMMILIIQVNLKVVKKMEKEFNMIIRMEKLYLKENLLMIAMKAKENTLMRMALIILENGKMDKEQEKEMNMIRMEFFFSTKNIIQMKKDSQFKKLQHIKMLKKLEFVHEP